MIGIKNSEGYDDPTAYKAIRNLDRECRHSLRHFRSVRAVRFQAGGADYAGGQAVWKGMEVRKEGVDWYGRS